MKKRITLWLLATFFLANVSLAKAQQPGKIFRIGFLDNSTAASVGVTEAGSHTASGHRIENAPLIEYQMSQSKW